MTIAVAADHHLETENDYRRTVQSGDDLSKAMYRIQATAREADPPHQDRDLPHRARWCRRASCSTGASAPSPGSSRTASPASTRTSGRGWATTGRAPTSRWAGSRDPAGGALEPLPVTQAAARADGAGIPAKGVTRLGVRRPLLLGHRDLRAPVPDLHQPVGGAERAAVPATAARAGPRAGRATSLSGGALFPWRTINGEEASAYYAAGTAQYHIDADVAYALSSTSGPPATRNSSAARPSTSRRDRAALGGPRLLARGGRRDVPHPRGHRAGRVHHRRQRQPLHERPGALQPAPRRARPWRRSARTTPRRTPRWSAGSGLDEASRWSGCAAPRA